MTPEQAVIVLRSVLEGFESSDGTLHDVRVTDVLIEFGIAVDAKVGA
jgi:hypothetical protein